MIAVQLPLFESCSDSLSSPLIVMSRPAPRPTRFVMSENALELAEQVEAHPSTESTSRVEAHRVAFFTSTLAAALPELVMRRYREDKSSLHVP